MESTIVIKVNYEETFRRFNAHVNEAGKLELDINKLRDKILCLFKLSPRVDLTLTYLDEDGDSVALIDEKDLHDVMKQSLNSLRITANVNTHKDNHSCSRSSGDFTPMRSLPKVSHPLLNLNNTVSETVPSSYPQLLELVLSFSTIMEYLMIIDSQKSTVSGNLCADLENTNASFITKESAALGGDGAKPKGKTIGGMEETNVHKVVDIEANKITGNRGMNVDSDDKLRRKEWKQIQEAFLFGLTRPLWVILKSLIFFLIYTSHDFLIEAWLRERFKNAKLTTGILFGVLLGCDCLVANGLYDLYQRYLLKHFRTTGRFGRFAVNLVTLGAAMAVRMYLPDHGMYSASVLGIFFVQGALQVLLWLTIYLYCCGYTLYLVSDMDMKDIYVGLLTQIVIYMSSEKASVYVFIFFCLLICNRFYTYNPTTPDSVKKDL